MHFECGMQAREIIARHYKLQPPVHNVLIEEAFDVEDDGAGLFIF
jgi:hypothetical protein